MATLYRVLLALNGVKGPDFYQAGDSSIQPGFVVSRDDSDEVKICPTSGTRPFGVAGATTYQDLNTVIAVGERVAVFLCGSGVDIMVLHDDDTGAATLGRPQYFVPDDANAGAVMVRTYAAKAGSYTAGNFTELHDTAMYTVGKLIEDITISGDTATYIKIKLSL